MDYIWRIYTYPTLGSYVSIYIEASLHSYNVEWTLILCDDCHLSPSKCFHESGYHWRNIDMTGKGMKKRLELLSIIQTSRTWCKWNLLVFSLRRHQFIKYTRITIYMKLNVHKNLCLLSFCTDCTTVNSLFQFVKSYDSYLWYIPMGTDFSNWDGGRWASTAHWRHICWLRSVVKVR